MQLLDCMHGVCLPGTLTARGLFVCYAGACLVHVVVCDYKVVSTTCIPVSVETNRGGQAVGGRITCE